MVRHGFDDVVEVVVGEPPADGDGDLLGGEFVDAGKGVRESANTLWVSFRAWTREVVIPERCMWSTKASWFLTRMV